MKLTPQHREKLAWIIVSLVALIVSITLGVSYPLPMQRAPQGEPIVELGTTHFSGLNVTGAVDFDTTLNVDGATTLGGNLTLSSANYPLEFASAGSEAIYGTATITGTATAAHGFTTVTFALCTLGEDPESGAGDGAMCTVSISANVVTLDIWQDDFVSAATETDVVIHWLVIGVP